MHAKHICRLSTIQKSRFYRIPALNACILDSLLFFRMVVRIMNLYSKKATKIKLKSGQLVEMLILYAGF